MEAQWPHVPCLLRLLIQDMRPPHVDRRCHIQAPRLLLCLYFLSILSTQGTTWIWILGYLVNTLDSLAFGHHHDYHQLRRVRSRLRQREQENVGGTKIRKIRSSYPAPIREKFQVLDRRRVVPTGSLVLVVLWPKRLEALLLKSIWILWKRTGVIMNLLNKLIPIYRKWIREYYFYVIMLAWFQKWYKLISYW